MDVNSPEAAEWSDMMRQISAKDHEIAKLREWIVMADNRLECKDCPQCVDIARSYLQEALNPNEQQRESRS